MRKTFSLLVLAIVLSWSANAQSSLAFSRALIISNNLETVPEGKVWKVTAIYGADVTCLLNSTLYTTATAPVYQNYYVSYSGSGMLVNGVDVPSQRIWRSPSAYPTRLYVYTDNQCKNVYTDVDRLGTSFDVSPNPNMLPQWLPAGTTLQSITNKVFISVLEFNIQ